MRKLTKEEIAYYKDVDNVKIGGQYTKEALDRIELMAYEDIDKGRKKRTKSDFKSVAEYNLYLVSVFDIADRVSHNLPVDFYVED